ILAAVAMARLEGRRFDEFGMPLRGAFGGEFWKGLVWGLVTVSALMLLIFAFGGYSFGELALSGGELWLYALKWAAVFLLVGIYEEFFFRGYLQYTLTMAVRFWPAALVTSAIFGAAHLRNPGEGIVGALSVFLTGIFLCL